MQPIVSIIIPVYNAQKTLERCLNSIKAQSLQSFEVLMINDNDTDNSGTICEHYAELYEEFKVIHIANGGVSNARNVGIEHSKGLYLTFVDADDYIEPSFWN
jgi:glycosyltransferase involved in cell wall biosynthesis